MTLYYTYYPWCGDFRVRFYRIAGGQVRPVILTPEVLERFKLMVSDRLGPEVVLFDHRSLFNCISTLVEAVRDHLGYGEVVRL